jgi:hypothetical protein
MRGALAQLVEQRTENPCVPGSIPGGTTLIKNLRFISEVFFSSKFNIIFINNQGILVFRFIKLQSSNNFVFQIIKLIKLYP